MELPVDIILYICRNHLPPASTQALSLTCKSLFALASRQAGLRLTTSDREEFLLLLEKDIGHNRYYCHTCRILHCFLHEHSVLQAAPWTLPQNDCRRQNLVYLSGNSVAISYHHVRLAMNRHFLGPPNGLPLTRFRLDNASSTPGPLCWKQTWSARILHDELFLSATRTLCIPDVTDEALRQAVDRVYHRVCNHVSTHKYTNCRVKALQRPGSTDLHCPFTPCWNIVESCRHCLTDYETTVERRWIKTRGYGEQRGRVKASWFITVTSYHRLGGGRSPWDAKWRMFKSGRFTTSLDIPRNMFLYPHGEVRQMWKDAEGQPDGLTSPSIDAYHVHPKF